MFLRFNFQDDFLELPKEHQSNLLGLLMDNLGDQFKPHKLLPPSLRQVPLALPTSLRQGMNFENIPTNLILRERILVFGFNKIPPYRVV